MTLLLNNAEGGVLGGTVTTGNSGGASGDAWGSVSVTAGKGTLIYDNTHVANGSLAYEIATPSNTAATVDVTWNPSQLTGGGTTLTLWQRMNLYFTANPTNAHRIMGGAAGSLICGGFRILTTGKLAIIDSLSAQKATSATTIPLNQWFRVESFITGANPTGQLEIKLFSHHTDTVPLETVTTGATLNTLNAGNGINTARFGDEAGTPVLGVGPYWADDLGASTTGYIGPATLAVTAADTASFSEGATIAAQVHATDTASFAESALVIIGGLGISTAGDSKAQSAITQDSSAQSAVSSDQSAGSASSGDQG